MVLLFPNKKTSIHVHFTGFKIKKTSVRNRLTLQIQRLCKQAFSKTFLTARRETRPLISIQKYFDFISFMQRARKIGIKSAIC